MTDDATNSTDNDEKSQTTKGLAIETARLIKNSDTDIFSVISGVAVVSTLLVHPKHDKLFPIFATTLVDGDGFEIAKFSVPVDDMIEVAESLKKGVISGLEKIAKIEGIKIDDHNLFSQAKQTLENDRDTSEKLMQLLDTLLERSAD